MDYINLEGNWVNEFGSTMTITSVDMKTGVFSGTYASHTGATGVYNLTGITDTRPDPKVNSQTVAFTIAWRNVDPEGDQEGAHWVSGFTGQLQVSGGQEKLSATYLLQQHTDPSNNWGSTIIATATFTRQ